MTIYHLSQHVSPILRAVCSQRAGVCLAADRSKVRTIQLILTLFIIIAVREGGSARTSTSHRTRTRTSSRMAATLRLRLPMSLLH